MRTQIHINSITDNYLDRCFQKCLLPFRYFQHVVFLSCFSIEYNCVRPHRTSYYIFSLIGTLGFIIFHLHILTSQDFEEVENVFISFFVKLNIFMMVVPYVSFYTLNIILRKDHVRMILKIQKAFRLINYKQYKKSIIRNWFGILWHSLEYIFSNILALDILVAVYFYSLLYFDVNLTYGIAIIALLRDGIISWIFEVEYYSNLCSELGEEKYNEKLKKLFQAYINLMEAYEIFKKIFKFSTLFQALDTFFHTLLYLQALIESIIADKGQYGAHDLESFGKVTILWAIKNVLFVTILSTYCERFYLSVTQADAACSKLLKSLQNTVEAKKLCKNVRRLNRAAFHKMTACQIFTIDGSLPRKFNSLIVEYIVVLLQFAVLSWMNKSNHN